VGSFAGTAQFGELVVLSVNGRAAEDVIRLAGIENLNGKIVLDASDPLDFSSGRPGLFVGTTDSLGERIQRLIPNAYVVKGLNIVQADVMINPSLSGGDPDMFIAGDSDEAKRTVRGLLREFGWPVIDMGGIESARWLEAISLAWSSTPTAPARPTMPSSWSASEGLVNASGTHPLGDSSSPRRSGVPQLARRRAAS
jgi:8-hydroxy-5-deazaflavin:NADPH oxidoreductase